MFTYRLAPALASVGLGLGILLTAPLAHEISILGGGRPAPLPAVASARPAAGEIVARLSASRLALDSPVFEGVDAGVLARGAGHVPGTSLPGEEGKSGPSVIAIARGSNGAAVAGLRLGDRVKLTTFGGPKHYRVTERRVLAPARLRLDAPSGARITLIAPYPSDFAGPAPLRLAVALERMPD